MVKTVQEQKMAIFLRNRSRNTVKKKKLPMIEYVFEGKCSLKHTKLIVNKITVFKKKTYC